MSKETRRRLLAAVMALSALLIAGCTVPVDDGNGPGPAGEWPRYVPLPDGRKVLCIWAQNGGGLSCDWLSAQRGAR